MEAEFIHILNSNKDTIFRICNAYASQHNEAGDLFQEVLLNIWKALPGFQHQSAVSTWVYRITLNVCMRARHNADKKKNIIHLEGLQLEYTAATPGTPANKQYEELYACIRRLQDTDKSLILLYLEDLSYKDIAAITGLTENHVAVKIKRIRTKLFNCLKPGNGG